MQKLLADMSTKKTILFCDTLKMLFEGLGRGVFYAIYTLNLWEPHIMFFVLEFKKKYFNDKVKKKKSLY